MNKMIENNESEGNTSNSENDNINININEKRTRNRPCKSERYINEREELIRELEEKMGLTEEKRVVFFSVIFA